jgi:HemY protein
MIRWLIGSLIAVMAGTLIALAVLRDNGYILIGYDVWSIEGSLALFILLDVILFAVLYLTVRFFVRLWQTPSTVKTWHHQRQIRLAQKSLTRGLLEMAEGDWKGAEKRLLKHAANAETPLLNYLAAARAAQLQGEHERRDQYLQLAHESMPSADIAVSLTQAELQLAHQQMEQALATLKHLKSIAPKHVYVLKLLSELYQQLDDWQQLRELLPELKKRKACSPSELEQLESRIHLFSLQQAAGQDLPALENAWKQIPRKKRFQTSLVIEYARHLVSLNEPDKAIKEINQCLNKHRDKKWDDGVLIAYANINGSNPSIQLTVAEDWLKIKSSNPALLLMLARLSLKARLWGKARSYLEASIEIHPTISAYHELGNLLEQMGETDQARQYYRLGLDMDSESRPVELPENLQLTKHQEESQRMPIPTDRTPPPAQQLEAGT